MSVTQLTRSGHTWKLGVGVGKVFHISFFNQFLFLSCLCCWFLAYVDDLQALDSFKFVNLWKV